ncbi:DUF2214 domain-containing protein [Roseomonas eburnea]|uniref:DUF2214 domain-containing protein n=2 Tax=Neoroseomonas eburnea TaxID=1346889 RepID=A0A9X9XF12_9PROT|nr:DUF6644 family protein [Neoroseomonas eburnea]MBR0682298.1 DUF2214 domain-containing protein [Neoroseomonas eburnea]
MPVVAVVRDSAVVYPLVNAAHVAAIGVLLGSIVTLDLRLMGLFRTHPVAHLAVPLTRMAVVGLLLAAPTGLLLFLTRPSAYLENPAFLAKLGILSLGLLNALVLRFNPGWLICLETGRLSWSVRAAALFSLLVWLAAVVAGRWIGFLQ